VRQSVEIVKEIIDFWMLSLVLLEKNETAISIT
jgi:hypothetical protein